MIRITCPGCDAKLTVKESLAGKTGKCPQCGERVPIPANDSNNAKCPDLSEFGDELQDPFNEAVGPTVPAARQNTKPDTIEVAGSLEGESEGGSKIFHRPDEHVGEPDDSGPTAQAGAAREKPATLGELNRYLIVDHEQVVAMWRSDGKGWMLRRPEGFVRAVTAVSHLPKEGRFVFVEVEMTRREEDAIVISDVRAFDMERQYALTKLAKGEEAVLDVVLAPTTLTAAQRDQVRDAVADSCLADMLGDFRELLDTLVAS